VHSFDYDLRSVACTAELKQRYFPQDENWTVGQGSALDEQYMKSLGKFDIVYSWGVLHHTGDMWRALDFAQLPVGCGGKLFIAIYNKVGSRNARWKLIKKTYNKLPALVRPVFTFCVTAPGEAKTLLRALLTLSMGSYVRTWVHYGTNNRGMTNWRDTVDWVGGYPYEFAKPEEIFDFYRERGFSLVKLKCGDVGLGCNEFVFLREAERK
jgi:2-polyprenyl-6-hydroxyphenyl methylase/3-demethylubiquinone-9 3-methyltransferase